MKEFKKDSTLARFGRDKRQRTTSTSTERVERRPRMQREAAESGREAAAPRKRASYNPHFNEENRPNFESPKRSYDRKPREEGRSFATRKFGAENERAERTERTERRERPAYGEKRYGDKSARPAGKFEGKKRAPYRRDEKPRSYPQYDPNKQSGEMRLNRYLAQSGICSRREADDFITAGLVSVNGQIITELGTKVMPGDEVKFNDSRVQGEKLVYLVLNKPKGYVTTVEDPHNDKTVMDLIKGACTERVFPVGRLDKITMGLLLFTNDGDLAKQITHPSHKKKKIYQVSLDKPLTRADMEQIAEGLVLEDGEIHADEISYVHENKKEVGVEIHSGRNRIVRRIFEYLGYTVLKLDRVYYAGLTKKNLKRGQWRFLTREEVERLKSGRYE